jgi:hypothetical protein
MGSINPFIGSILQAPQVQAQQATEKDAQARQTEERRKNAGAITDYFEHAVESSEAIAPIHEEEHGNDPRRRKSSHQHSRADDNDEEQPPRLDLTA